MNCNYLKCVSSLLNLWFGDLFESTNYKSIFVNNIVYSDCKKFTYLVDLDVVLLNNYSFNIILDFVEDRFSIFAYSDSNFRCYKHISGDLNYGGATHYVSF